jgi:hypothetical protein
MQNPVLVQVVYAIEELPHDGLDHALRQGGVDPP